MPAGSPRRVHRTALGVALACAATGGCAGVDSITPEATGLGVGAGAGVLTANPIIGVAAGLAARLATAEAIGYVQREQQKQVHIAIAAAGGSAPVETPVRWATTPNPVYDSLFGTINGRALVLREFGQNIRCREIVYTVDADAGGIAGDVDAVVSPEASPEAGPGPDGAAAAAEDVGQSGAGAAAGAGGAKGDAGTPWPPAGGQVLLAAVICRSTLGWQWAVSAPAAAAP